MKPVAKDGRGMSMKSKQANAERMRKLHADPELKAKRIAHYEATISLRLLPDEG